MGCATSRELRCKHCNAPYSPGRRSFSVPRLRHSKSHPSKGSDSDNSRHVYPHNATTLDAITPRASSVNPYFRKRNSNKYDESPVEVIQDKIIAENNLKTVKEIETTEEQPETINTWELMEGLEDNNTAKDQYLDSDEESFSFHRKYISTEYPSASKPPLPQKSNASSPHKPGWHAMSSEKPAWLQIMANDSQYAKSIMSDFDPEIISTFRRTLEELSPRHALKLHRTEFEKTATPSPGHTRGASFDTIGSKSFFRRKKKVVIYFTTLRGVRKTYEDSCKARVILKGTGYIIDERDVSMHQGFKEELKELLGGEHNFRLPNVFVKGRCLGGATEIQRMHEDGELQEILEGCEKVDEGGGGGFGVSDACGDVRFVPCANCSGSCKVFCEDEEMFQRCPDCNENGIIRCPACCTGKHNSGSQPALPTHQNFQTQQRLNTVSHTFSIYVVHVWTRVVIIVLLLIHSGCRKLKFWLLSRFSNFSGYIGCLSKWSLCNSFTAI